MAPLLLGSLRLPVNLPPPPSREEEHPILHDDVPRSPKQALSPPGSAARSLRRRTQPQPQPQPQCRSNNRCARRACICNLAPPYDIRTGERTLLPPALLPNSRPGTASCPGTATIGWHPGTAPRPGTNDGQPLRSPGRPGQRHRNGRAAAGTARNLLNRPSSHGKVVKTVVTQDWCGIPIVNDRHAEGINEETGDEVAAGRPLSPKIGPPGTHASTIRKRLSVMLPGLSFDGHMPSGCTGVVAVGEVGGDGHPEGEQHVAKSRQTSAMDLQARQSTEIEAKAPDKDTVGEREHRREKRANTNGTLKSPLKERLKRLELGQHHRTRNIKTDRSKEVKRRNFSALPQSEADAYRRAFEQYDVDSSGQLDEKEAILCLCELGLNGTNPEERREIMEICQQSTPEFVSFLEQDMGDATPKGRVAIDLMDFALEVVPAVRQLLNHLRSEKILVAFFKVDSTGSGTLAGSEALEIARGMGIDQRTIMEMQARQSTIGIVPTGQSDIDFHSLQELIAKGREKRDRVIRDRERNVKKFTGISDQLFQDFRSDILTLHDIFIRYDTDGSGSLGRAEVMVMLKEFGLMPKTSYEREEVEFILKNNDADGNGEFSFQEFLELIREIRYYLQERCRGQQLAAFEKYDKDKSGSMNHKEICHLLVDLQFVPRSQKEQEELAQLIQDIDVDGSGTIDFSEFQVLSQRIDEKLKSMRYEEEIEFAMLRGFTETQMRDFRWVFDSMDSDGSGKLEMQEVKNGLTMLGKQNIAPEAFDSCWEEVDADGSGELDFFEFLEFMKLMRDGESMFSEETQRLTGRPCSLDTRVLRRTLESFRISTAYLKSQSKDELVTLFCDYFHVRPEQDLSESLGVRSVGDLYELAVRRDQELQKPEAKKQTQAR